MHSVSLWVSLLAITGLSTICRAQNITTNNTDPSIIYEGRAGDASLCEISETGAILSKPGCYLIPRNCTNSVSMAQNDPSAAATFKFNGTAIYVNSLRYKYSPLYSITLDGESTDVDGAAGFTDTASFQCPAPLFSKEGLDPNVQHEIRVAAKATSPSYNQSEIKNPGGFEGVWSLVSFVYTPSSGSGAPSGSPSGSANPSGQSPPGPSSSSSGEGPKESSNDAQKLGFSVVLGVGFATIISLL